MAASDQNPVTEAEFEETRSINRQAAAPAARRIQPERVAELLGDQTPSLPPALVVELSARFPYKPSLAQLYAFNVSRWDSKDDIVYMYPVRPTPDGLGQVGTFAYVDFYAPNDSEGKYLVVANYAGVNTMVNLNGPWGTVAKSMPAGSDADAVVASWTGSGQLYFTVTFKGDWLGYLGAIQIFRIG